MFDYKLESVEKKLRKLYEKGQLSHREIYVFGVSESTRQIIQILRTFHLEPKYVLDNDKRKQNTFCSGILVIPIEKVKQIEDKQKFFILYSLYWREMA
ncbi:hypothetical protein D3Z55_24960, partial [Clostridiaceae bacterium]|nr:hypothetical protein [Clostridiaceae bacterium]